MRRQIIIRSTFARALDQKFRTGQKVYYTKNFGSGPEYPAIILGIGKRDGDTVYDVRLDYEGAKEHTNWGYEDQFRARDGVKDVDRPEDEAYKAGANSRRTDQNPYTSSELKAAWERGRKVRKQAEKFSSSARMGEYPVGPGSKRTAFIQPRIRDAKDFKSERGYVARILNSLTGNQLQQSPPFISERSANRWIQEQIVNFVKLGKKVSGKVDLIFYDPALIEG